MNNIPKGYKQTEVGVIPEEWRVESFLHVTDLITCGIAATPKYVAENIGYPFLSSTNIKNGVIQWTDYKYIDASLHRQLHRNNPPKRGDILYSRVGTIGEAAVIEVDFEFSVYVSLTLIKPKTALDSYFLAHLLNSLPYKQRAKDQVYLGGGVGNLNVDVVRRYPIIFPPILEQRAIAAVLSNVDALLAKLDQLIAKKRDLKLATMQQLLTGQTRLPGFGPLVGAGSKPAQPIPAFGEPAQMPDDTTTVGAGSKPALSKPAPNHPGISTMTCLARAGLEPAPTVTVPEGWEVKRLGDILDKIIGGGTPSRSNTSYWGDEIPWVTVKDFTTFNPTQTQEAITKDGLKHSASNLIQKGTLIISTRMALGKAVIYDMDVSINQDLKALFPKKNVSGKFLYYWFEYFASVIDDLGSGSTVKGIRLTDLRAIEFNLASLPEQTAIATVLSDMDAEIAALEARRDKTRDIKQGMMQELLTGRIRLV